VFTALIVGLVAGLSGLFRDLPVIQMAIYFLALGIGFEFLIFILLKKYCCPDNHEE
jgi:hypothetical protein